MNDSKPDSEGYVLLGYVARGLLNMQCQYASHYIYGYGNKPCLKDDFRFKNVEKHDYHAIRIHQDDVERFVQTLKTLRGQ